MTKVINEKNWRDIWRSNVNNQIPKSLAHETLERMGGEKFFDTGTERAKFGVSVQISTCFQMGPSGCVTKNVKIIDLVNNFRRAGRNITGFDLPNAPESSDPISQAVRKEGWSVALNSHTLLQEFENRISGKQRLMEALIADGVGWSDEEADTIQRSHVGVINTGMMWKW